MSLGALAEMRSRLIAGLKRYYHGKRLEGLLSVQVGERRAPARIPFAPCTALPVLFSHSLLLSPGAWTAPLQRPPFLLLRRACASSSTRATTPRSMRSTRWAFGACCRRKSRYGPFFYSGGHG